MRHPVILGTSYLRVLSETSKFLFCFVFFVVVVKDFVFILYGFCFIKISYYCFVRGPRNVDKLWWIFENSYFLIITITIIIIIVMKNDYFCQVSKFDDSIFD